MTTLTKIGNSQGIRIPKALIKQAHLENAVIELEIVENGLLIKPIHTLKRVYWQENIKSVLAQHHNKKDSTTIDEWLDDSDLEDYQW